MSLIKCRACGKDVSENAPTCPNCGEPINRKEAKKLSSGGIDFKDPVHIIGLIIAILIVAGVVYCLTIILK